MTSIIIIISILFLLSSSSVCAALDDVPIQRCSLRLSGNDDDKHEENHLYIFTFTLFFHHQPESKNLKDPQILLRDLQSVDVNLTEQSVDGIFHGDHGTENDYYIVLDVVDDEPILS